MKQANSILPPITIAPDIRAAIDDAVEKSGAAQAVIVRQGLRFGIGRFLETVAQQPKGSPSSIREIIAAFPPIKIPTNWKNEIKAGLSRKYGR